MNGDKLLLLDHFRERYASQAQQAPFTFAAEASALWSRYSFPGNVRELRNIVIRLTAKFPGQIVPAGALEAELDLQDEPLVPLAAPPPLASAESDAIIAAASARLQQPEAFSLDNLLAETERSYIESALRLTHGNVSQAARLLGINRTTLYNRMESFRSSDVS
jgi:two-component system nitrogen regulation response regulator GlnG